MAEVSITFSNATPAEIRAANFMVSKINSIRSDRGLPEFGSVSDYISYVILEDILPKWLVKEARGRREETRIERLFDEADDATRQAMIDIATGGG